MENSSKQTSIFGYSIFCNCRKWKQSMGVITYFSIISKLVMCVHHDLYTWEVLCCVMIKNVSLHAQANGVAYQLCILHRIATCLNLHVCLPLCLHMHMWYSSGYRHDAHAKGLCSLQRYSHSPKSQV